MEVEIKICLVYIEILILGAPAEQRCRYIFRFYNLKNNGNMSIEEFR